MPTEMPPKDLVAIDVHVHPTSREAFSVLAPDVEGMAKYFGSEVPRLSMDQLAEQYRARRMMAVLLAMDTSTVSGQPPVPNDHIAEAVRRHADVFIGFAGVDPWKGRLAIDEARRAREVLGLRGLKLHPGLQKFAPNDERFYPLWEAAEELGFVCLFHSGTMGTGAGLPGGGGFKLKYVNPMLVDDIAADFPSLQIILAHPGWPWQSEQLAMARHKANVYIDLSGWSPTYFPPELVQQMNGPLQDKCLFGSDWPFLTPERWLADFAALTLKEAVRPKVLRENARRLLFEPATPGGH
jgi:predicted TIM-barrel fold metal-dependent hydrolase